MMAWRSAHVYHATELLLHVTELLLHATELLLHVLRVPSALSLPEGGVSLTVECVLLL